MRTDACPPPRTHIVHPNFVLYNVLAIDRPTDDVQYPALEQRVVCPFRTTLLRRRPAFS